MRTIAVTRTTKEPAMSLLDKAVAAVTPLESDEDRAEARRMAEQAAMPGDWLTMILDHHRQLEMAFADAKQQRSKASLKALGVILTGHAIAEESVVYPALAEADHKAHAMMAYEEQAMVKTQMAMLEKLDPNSQDWLDKLEHIRGAVAHHMYEEEGTWFLELKQQGGDQAMITQRYREEFERYTGGVTGMGGSPEHEESMSIQPMQGDPATFR